MNALQYVKFSFASHDTGYILNIISSDVEQIT